MNLLSDVEGKHALELGCGTAYVSAWMARAGATPVGLDPTWEQLVTAKRLQREFGLRFPLILGAAEAVCMADRSFDLVISEYGAAIWSDPFRWIPEAARLLHPGGELIFLGNSYLLMLCVPDSEGDVVTDQLQRDHFGMYRFEWPSDTPPTVEFHLCHGDWIRLLRSNGFEVEDLIELQPPRGSQTRFEWITLEWARRWPCEEIWRARKR